MASTSVREPPSARPARIFLFCLWCGFGTEARCCVTGRKHELNKVVDTLPTCSVFGIGLMSTACIWICSPCRRLLRGARDGRQLQQWPIQRTLFAPQSSVLHPICTSDRHFSDFSAFYEYLESITYVMSTLGARSNPPLSAIPSSSETPIRRSVGSSVHYPPSRLR